MTAKTAAAPKHEAAPQAFDWRPATGLAGRLLVGALLAASGAHKAAAPPEEFMVVLEGYGLLPEVYLPMFARLLPWTELIAGVFLAAGLWTKAAAGITAGLSASFFLALAVTKLRGIELPNCGCFGQALHLERWQAMLLDVTLIALSVAAWRWGRRKAALDNWVDGGS
ncbi:MAG: DoxX family membrane protein [Elusimicrobia bacterium]|nr:DoxX family membrane protein [Elusimicrobiota bacterium]